MPSWSIHLAIGKRILKELKLDHDLFLYGSLIPDVDKDTGISRFTAHFYGDLHFNNSEVLHKINEGRFLQTYKNEMNNALILGYYAHLLIDNYYNSIIYSKSYILNTKMKVCFLKLKNGKLLDISNNKKRIADYRHSDLELYGRYLYKSKVFELNKININYEKVMSNIKYLKPMFLNEKLVSRRISYLKNEFNNFNKTSIINSIFQKYKIFYKKEYDRMFDDCSSYVLDELKKIAF